MTFRYCLDDYNIITMDKGYSMFGVYNYVLK